MGDAKVVAMTVRPLQASHLCFEVEGILGDSGAQLGAPVPAFDFDAFYAILGSVPTVAGDPSRLLYDFLAIEAAVGPFTLAALRAEPRKAALNKAINARQNAYFAKYGNASAIITQMNESYSLSVLNSKPNRLAILSALADDQATALKDAYTGDKRLGVIKNTSSFLYSQTQSQGGSSETGETNQDEIGGIGGTQTITLPGLPSGGQPITGAYVTGGASENTYFEQGTSGENSSSTGSAQEAQAILNTDYGYRMPFFESQAQNQRAQISLIDEQFSQFMFCQNLPNLAQVFANELQSIDGDVYRLQVAYLNTILMSPIAGTVTGIYKYPGDAVRAGEPVVRVENSAVVLLVANLVYRGPIALGASVTVETTLFDLPGLATSVTGSVVAVRGQREDDQWEVVVQCDNLNASNEPIFPLGYHFDYDDTTVSIT